MWAETYNSFLNIMSCKVRNLPQEARVLAGIRKVMIDNKTNMSSYYISVAKRANEILRCLNRRLSIRKDTFVSGNHTTAIAKLYPLFGGLQRC